jgi:hypothetical protein
MAMDDYVLVAVREILEARPILWPQIGMLTRERHPELAPQNIMKGGTFHYLVCYLDNQSGLEK